MMMKKFVPMTFTLAVGAAFGVAFVLSCSDGSHKVDAGTCDCPASEPPLAGRFVTVTSGPTVTIAPGAIDGGAAITCPVGSQFLSGSCTTSVLNPLPADLVLMESGFFNDPPSIPTGWTCVFQNKGNTAVTVTARALCLMPGT